MYSYPLILPDWWTLGGQSSKTPQNILTARRLLPGILQNTEL